MKRVRRYLSRFGRSAKRFLGGSASDRPNLHQTAFLARFATGEDKLDGAAVAYFAKTLAAAGFFSIEEIPAVITEYSEKTAWRTVLLDEAYRLRLAGLPVYATLGPPLDGGLDWSRLPRNAKDRLYQLRPHRFGFLPRLAIAASCGADTLSALLATLDRWIARVDQEADSTGAYHSNLVVIYRLLAVSWAAPFCVVLARDGSAVAAQICLRLFQILAADVQFLRTRLNDAAANNHLLADRFAGWFLATCYPDLYRASDHATLERSWQNELCRQFHADGTNFEQSTHYHEIGCELAVAYLVISLRCGTQPQESVLTRIGSMLHFQATLADHQGNTFALGDATDDPLLPLDAGAGWGSGAWRVIYRALFNRLFPQTEQDARGAERAFWILCSIQGARETFLGSAIPVGGLVAFPDGGYVMFRDEYQSQLTLFRTGPREGVTVYPGHAMADLLSVYWTVAGRPVMEPSGTYSYAVTLNPEEWPSSPRDYFRGPVASNGLVLRGHDPLGRPAGRFRGGDIGTRVATQWRSHNGVLGWAEGRLDEAGPLNGYRRGVLHVPGRYTLVYDLLPALPEDASVSCHWQFAPEAKVRMGGLQQASIDIDGQSMFLCAGGDIAAMEWLTGRTNPPAGWVSRRYGQLQAAPQLIGAVAPRGQRLAFMFGVDEQKQGPPKLGIRPAERTGLLLEAKLNDCTDITCIGAVSAGKDVLGFDLEFHGIALWLTITADGDREIRSLGLRRLRSKSLDLDLTAETAGSSRHGKWRLAKHQGEIDGISGQWEYRSVR